MIHHYLTKYRDNAGKRFAESWFQLNLFRRRFIFADRKIELGAK
ncbi:hypothetical protein [Lacticaseibacillus suibinensis]|nr:hypothetical protein [Lacticaseibacillus suibinensis]